VVYPRKSNRFSEIKLRVVIARNNANNFPFMTQQICGSFSTYHNRIFFISAINCEKAVNPIKDKLFNIVRKFRKTFSAHDFHGLTPLALCNS